MPVYPAHPDKNAMKIGVNDGAYVRNRCLPVPECRRFALAQSDPMPVVIDGELRDAIWARPSQDSLRPPNPA